MTLKTIFYKNFAGIKSLLALSEKFLVTRVLLFSDVLFSRDFRNRSDDDLRLRNESLRLRKERLRLRKESYEDTLSADEM